jgi:SagB-type dehydrogenase family enzyme
MAIRKVAFARIRTALLVLALCAGGIGPAAGDDAVVLPAPSLDGTVPVERALAQRRSLREFAPGPLPLSSVSQLLWAAQGITDPSGLRTAPSAGALYPLEVYLVVGAVSGLAPGVYRYDPRRHLLVPGAKGDLRAGVAASAHDQAWVADAPAILVIGAIYQRTVRKYGKRATRYVHMEVGHAAQNVYLQAAALGLGTTMVGAYRDEEIARLLELPERVDPLGLLPVGRRRSP